MFFEVLGLMRWQTLKRQVFTIRADLEGESYQYQYQLVLEWGGSAERSRVGDETLLLNGKPLFSFEVGKASLFNDHHEHQASYPFDWFRSALATVLARPENTKLTTFKQWLSTLYCLNIDPRQMCLPARKAEEHPNGDLSNFAAWYLYLAQQTREMGQL